MTHNSSEIETKQEKWPKFVRKLQDSFALCCVHTMIGSSTSNRKRAVPLAACQQQQQTTYKNTTQKCNRPRKENSGSKTLRISLSHEFRLVLCSYLERRFIN